MSAYFGNGYFLNILQRGARPVGNAHSKRTQAPFRFEETVETTGTQPSEFSSETFAVQNDFPAHPAAIANQPLKDDPLTESVRFQEPEPIQVTTRFPSHELPEISSGIVTHQTSETLDTQSQESNAPLHSSEPSSLQEMSSPPVEPPVHRAGHGVPPLQIHNQAVSSGEEPSKIQSTSSVFELRMPENFFANHVDPLPQSRVVPASVKPQAESRPAVDRSSGSVVPANTVIVPKHRDEGSKLQSNELIPPGPITDSQPTPQQPTVVSEAMDHVTLNKAQPARLIAAETLESSAPAPRVEPSSGYLQLRQPSIAPAPVTPPPRLQINRIDIQVVNQVPPPPPPPARVPDVSQVLEKHLGRVGLLL